MGMSKAEEEEQARLERARAVALFRYRLIREAAEPALSTRQRGAMVRESRPASTPGRAGEPVQVSRRTLDRWIRAWRDGRVRGAGAHRRASASRGPRTRCWSWRRR